MLNKTDQTPLQMSLEKGAPYEVVEALVTACPAG
jgi:hypothetical protein